MELDTIKNVKITGEAAFMLDKARTEHQINISKFVNAAVVSLIVERGLN